MITYIILFIISLGLSLFCSPLLLFGPKKGSEYFSLKFFSENKALPVFLVVGILLGLNNISQSLWGDEAWHTLVINSPFLRGLWNMFYDIHPPLWRTICFVVTYIFGDSEEVLRAIPLFSFSISIWLLYLLLKTLYSTKSAIVGCSFFVFSPISICYAQEGRPYTFLIMIFLFLLNILINKNVTHHFLKFQIFGILLASTHILGFVVNGLIFITLLIVNLRTYKSLLLTYFYQHLIILPSYFNIFLFHFVGYAIYRVPSLWHPDYAGRLEVEQLLCLPADYLFNSGYNTSSIIFSISFFVVIIVFIIYRYFSSKMMETNFALEPGKKRYFEHLSLLMCILFFSLVAPMFYDFRLYGALLSKHNDMVLVFHKLILTTSLTFAVIYFFSFIVLKFLIRENNRKTIIFGEKSFFHLIIFLIVCSLTIGLFTIRNYIFLLPLFIIVLSGAIVKLKRNILIITVSVFLVAFNLSGWELNTKYESNKLKKIKIIPKGTVPKYGIIQYPQIFKKINAITNDTNICIISRRAWEVELVSKYYKFECKEIGETYKALNKNDCKFICTFDDEPLPKKYGQLVLEIPDEYTKTIVRCYKRW